MSAARAGNSKLVELVDRVFLDSDQRSFIISVGVETMKKRDGHRIVLVVSHWDDFLYEAVEKLKQSPKIGRLNKQRGLLELEGVAYQHVSRPEKMRGYHGVEVEFWGRFYEIKDLGEFELLAKYARME